jgi:hypothetical protein
VRCFNHVGDKFFRRLPDVYDIHLSPRNHYFADLPLRDLDDAFHHGESICIQQIALVSAVQ